MFERIIHNQLNEFMGKKTSKFLPGLGKNNNTPYALLRTIENSETQLNRRNKIGVIIIVDTLNNSLLVAF